MVSLVVGWVGSGQVGWGSTPRNCVTKSTRGEGERKLVIDWSGYNNMYSALKTDRTVHVVASTPVYYKFSFSLTPC